MRGIGGRSFAKIGAVILLAGTWLILVPTASGQPIPPVVPGFPNVPQTPGAILSGLNEPQQGRTAIIAYHNGVLFTAPELPASAPNSDFQVRTWDLSNPSNPVVTSTLGISPMPINAHQLPHWRTYQPDDP